MYFLVREWCGVVGLGLREVAPGRDHGVWLLVVALLGVSGQNGGSSPNDMPAWGCWAPPTP